MSGANNALEFSALVTGEDGPPAVPGGNLGTDVEPARRPLAGRCVQVLRPIRAGLANMNKSLALKKDSLALSG